MKKTKNAAKDADAVTLEPVVEKAKEEGAKIIDMQKHARSKFASFIVNNSKSF